MRTWSLQYASNLFVDIAKGSLSKRLHPVAPTLALVGNVGQIESPATKDFLRYCSDSWKSVLLVPGPWDLSSFQGNPFYKQADRLTDFTQSLKNVSVCEQAVVDVSGSYLSVLATGLFSDEAFRAQTALSSQYAHLYKLPGIPMSNLDVAEWHWSDKEWLKRVLCANKTSGQLSVVLTAVSPFGLLDGIVNKKHGIYSWVYGDHGVSTGTHRGVYTCTNNEGEEKILSIRLT